MTEELKTLVEAVNAVSGDAKDVLICWIVVKAAESFITSVATLGGILIVGRFFRFLVNSLCGSSRLRKSFGKENDECWAEIDLVEACKVLRESSK